MTEERIYTSRRQSIVKAITDKIKEIDGTGEYLTKLTPSNILPTLKFWDEIKSFPAVHLNAGSETREYQGGGFKDRYLTVTVRCYVNGENSVDKLADLLEDVETVLEKNSGLTYYDRRGTEQKIHQITIANIDTDEGVLDPLGVGEILLEVRY
jgi:hypothetical protein